MKRKAIGKGRKKIENKLITEHRARDVTFSKRKSGLFKRASELCVLCDAQIGIFLCSFSPKGCSFSFGNPDVNTIADRYLSNRNPQINVGEAFQRARRLHELTTELNKNLKELEIEKERGEELNKNLKHVCREPPIEELDLRDLEQLRLSMENLKKSVDTRVNEMLNQVSSSFGFFVTDTSKSNVENQAQASLQNEEVNNNSLQFQLPLDSFQPVDPFIMPATEASTSVSPLGYDFDDPRLWNF